MSRPHPDDYKMPHLEANFNASKLIASIFAVFLFFVLPIVAIESLGKSLSSISQEGQVAGVSTSSTEGTSNNLNILGNTINLNSQSGLLIIVGILLFGIAIILVIYLLVDDNTKQKKIKEKQATSPSIV